MFNKCVCLDELILEHNDEMHVLASMQESEFKAMYAVHVKREMEHYCAEICKYKCREAMHHGGL